MKQQTIINILSILFLMSLAFITGAGYKDQEWKAKVYTWNCDDVNDFFADSSWNELEGHKLNVPEEILEIESYYSKEVDLLASFIDEHGDVCFMYTGLKYPIDSLHLTP
jgi:hypothetical protein